MISDIEPCRLVEAAAWRTHLAETEAESSADLEAWLAEDPRNGAAWRRVQAPWKCLGEHATAPELIRLRRAALAHAHNAGRGRWIPSRRFAVPAAMAAAAGMVLIAAGALFLWQTQRSDVYRTSYGERRVITLSDGSQIALDSQSEVRVRYSARARELALTRGQARFNVAHAIERPFSVVADGHKVIATGTAFNVDLLGSNLFVTLIEGHVVVLPRNADARTAAPEGSLAAPSEPSSDVATHTAARADEGARAHSVPRIVLDAGEQLAISPTSAPNITHVNVDRATAWENGELVFENEPLSSVVARVNRYTAHTIVIGDDPTANKRISGVFHTGDIDAFVSTIVSYLPVQAQRTSDGAIRLTSR